jgi:phytoene synthase
MIPMTAGTTDGAPRGELDVLHAGLEEASASLRRQGLPVPSLEGKLLRPLFALAMVPADRWHSLDVRFWNGAMAIQMVHEASLLHDDVLDGAATRRGRPTLAATRGTGAALVMGDHFLTAAYRVAAATGSFEFLTRFTEAVEQTVAGEIAQGSLAGRRPTPREYDSAITGKSGELFGVAAVLGGTVAGLGEAELRHCLGCSFGNLYQRIDDLLDYCTSMETGKPPLQDYRQKKWSWILELADIDSFDETEDDVLEAVFSAQATRPSAARRGIEILRERQRLLLRYAPQVCADTDSLGRLLDQCLGAAERAVHAQERMLAAHRTAPGVESASPGAERAASGESAPESRASAEAEIRRLADRLGGPREWSAYFGEHARTFHLAARLFPPKEAGLVAGLYAYCRFTDDLVDDPVDDPSPETLRLRLGVWRELSLAAYEGIATGIPLLDAVMPEAAGKGVARLYPEALLDGVGMDLEPRLYESWAELERYTFGVAGAVGGWMTQLFGLHDPDLLDRAHALGHGMQLTNIARDVGEDWGRGRVYLPTELLEAHGVTREEIGAMAGGDEPISDAYRATVHALIGRADQYYEKAWPGIRALPAFFRRPVAAAASAYRGIHREIRRNGYDNLTMRAHTSTARKILLAGAGLLDASRASGLDASASQTTHATAATAAGEA